MKCNICGKELGTSDPCGNVCFDCLTNPPRTLQPYCCPACNGHGTVSRPPWVAGDVECGLIRKLVRIPAVRVREPGLCGGRL